MSEDSELQARQTLQRLLSEYRTGQLATVSDSGQPLASYVPWTLDDERRFYFFVSELSEHTRNLKETARASFMLIEDESRSEQLFARHRAIFDGPVRLLPRENEDFTKVAALHRAKFGKFFDTLAGFNDFQMFCLEPGKIRMVIGFGAAFAVSGARWDHFQLLGKKDMEADSKESA